MTRRKKKSAAARLLRFWVLFAFVVALLAVGGYYAATWPKLYPKRIEVAGNRIVSSAEILSRAGVELHRNLWLQNAGAMARRVEAIPYIEHAWIHRRIPADVTIEVSERTPFAIVQCAGSRALVDRELRVLILDPPRARLPALEVACAAMPVRGAFFTDVQARALRDDEGALIAAHIDAVTLSYDKYEELVVTLGSGIRILLGDDNDLQKKIPLIAPILTQLAHGRRFSAIDLRAPNTPVVIYK
jgi:cell division protein FtsQ